MGSGGVRAGAAGECHPGDSPGAPSGKSDPALAGCSVLIVDDHAPTCRALAETVARWGLRPETSGTAGEALEKLAHAAEAGEPFGVVLWDLDVPEWDGVDVVGLLWQGALKVVVMRGGAQPGDTARCRELDASAVVKKPVRGCELRMAIAAALSREVPGETPRSTAVAATPGSCRLRILLAEDNPVNQKVFQRMIEKFGHSVVVVGDGRQAVLAIHEQEFDLVLMDVQMPELDGMEAGDYIFLARMRTIRTCFFRRSVAVCCQSAISCVSS